MDTAFLPGKDFANDAAYRPDRAVQPKLADYRGVRIERPFYLTVGLQNRQGNCQVEAGAFFWNVGRRQVDCDPFPGHCNLAAGKGAAHTFARFVDGFVAKADDRDAWQAIGKLAFGIYDDAAGADIEDSSDWFWHVCNSRTSWRKSKDRPGLVWPGRV